jgi:dienelactone hydrolase
MKRRRLLAVPAAWPAARCAFAQADFIDDTWADPARNRALPLRIRWPAGGAPCAAVVYSHGLGGSRDGGDAWGRAWRDAGLAVIHVQHPGSDIDAVRGGGISALRRAASAEQLLPRVADMRFVLDELTRRVRTGAPPWARVQLDAIGAGGHSFGARTVQALAGQRFGSGAQLGEPRFKAFAAFSPAPGREANAPVAAFAEVTRPFLCLTGSHDQNPLGAERTGEHRLAVYDGLPPGQRALLWLDRADHMSFAGNAEQRIGAERGLFRRDADVAAREPAHHVLMARVSTLWWQAQLLADAAALAQLRAPQGLAERDRWRMD